MLKKIFLSISLLLVAVFFVSCANNTVVEIRETNNILENEDEFEEDGPKMNSYVLGDILEDEFVNVEINVKDYGVMKIELDTNEAPITVQNFVKLVNEGFYDGLTFHRIIEGFMIQGGDPLHNGTGGSDENIIGEFDENNISNRISHTRGTISMARAADYNSASSQFFICHQDAPWLDGQYAGFGYVVDGIEVVDKICETVIPIDGDGTVLFENQPVIEYIKIIK